ncbi:hypothetical protein GCM10010218_37000 [Streptomyces mashuensis]|uniref:Hydrolase n=1 Tax=Streptomyces mashuensis TaxID=33904 RepID=A0A919B410_9ACTN|nr:HAD family hydrolase [Streptomyces mashuensis]GHF52184.1 hypothetical protein GCM10010218_37000 [Streptomyces mashuensis]
MIRTLFVDAGGVLYNNINEETDFLARVAGRHGADPGELLTRVLKAAPAYEDGGTHVHEVFRDLLEAEAPLDTGWLDRAYLESVRAYDDNFRALREARRDHPHLTVVLTNNEAEHWDRLKDAAHGHFGLFDVLCSSWRLGRVKPAREFFTAALHHVRAVPAETLVVDDRTAVLEVAAGLGMRTLHVGTPDVLAGRLAPAVRGDAVPTAL